MENEDFGRTFNKLQELLASLTLTPEDDRVVLYQSIDPLLLTLEGELGKTADASAFEKMNELKVHLIALARLDEPDGHTDDQHYRWAMTTLHDLRGSDAFAKAMSN